MPQNLFLQWTSLCILGCNILDLNSVRSVTLAPLQRALVCLACWRQDFPRKQLVLILLKKGLK